MLKKTSKKELRGVYYSESIICRGRKSYVTGLPVLRPQNRGRGLGRRRVEEAAGKEMGRERGKGKKNGEEGRRSGRKEEEEGEERKEVEEEGKEGRRGRRRRRRRRGRGTSTN